MEPLDALRTRASFLVRAKPNSRETKVLSHDVEHDVFLVAVHAPPVEGKANAELEKYFSKLLKKKVTLKSGHASKTKRFVVE